MNPTIVINFGMCRTGTTYIHKMLQLGHGYLTDKLGEYEALHPCNSRTGLIDLAKAMRRVRVVYVRTIRPFKEIDESFAASAEDEHDWKIEDLGTYYTCEYQNVEDQQERFPDNVRMVTIEFDRLEDPKYRLRVARQLTDHVKDPRNERIFTSWMDSTWGTKPVRTGRLSRRLGIEVQ